MWNFGRDDGVNDPDLNLCFIPGNKYDHGIFATHVWDDRFDGRVVHLLDLDAGWKLVGARTGPAQNSHIVVRGDEMLEYGGAKSPICLLSLVYGYKMFCGWQWKLTPATATFRAESDLLEDMATRE